MNVELLQKVKKHILAEPRRLDMDDVMRTVVVDPDLPDNPPCGSVGCIAGWACRLTGSPHEALWKAQEILNLDNRKASRLFTEPKNADANPGYAWPSTFANEYMAAKTPKQRAKITAKRIDHFIATNGEE